MIKNRLYRNQPDYILSIVRKPANWQPSNLEDVPLDGKPLATYRVASFEEAFDDLLRCNKIALRDRLDLWAVIYSTDCSL